MRPRSNFMPGRPALLTALILVFSLASAGEALAQRAFLFVPGIPGDSTVEGYVDWINVLSIRQSATASSRRSIACDLSVVKNIDIAGPALWATAASGLIIPEMLISVLKNGADTTAKLYDIRLTNVRITAVQASAGAADASETITLLPQGATLTYYPQSPSGAAVTPVMQSFSCQ
jgi:type VI protein secretion system component Hcp